MKAIAVKVEFCRLGEQVSPVLCPVRLRLCCKSILSISARNINSRSGWNCTTRIQKKRRADSIVANFYFTEPAWRLLQQNRPGAEIKNRQSDENRSAVARADHWAQQPKFLMSAADIDGRSILPHHCELSLLLRFSAEIVEPSTSKNGPVRKSDSVRPS